MYRYGAKTIQTMCHITVVVSLAFSFTTDKAYCDPRLARYTDVCHQSPGGGDNDDLQAGSSFCRLKREVQHSRYLKAPHAFNESTAFTQSDDDMLRADLLAIFKLALEEFDVLSGIRIHWEYTEKNIEAWAIKLRLKGEVAVSDPYQHTHKQPFVYPKAKRHSSQTRFSSTSMLSIFKPQKIRWNLGVDPDDLTVFGELHFNPHYRFSFDLGDGKQVGLHFQLRF